METSNPKVQVSQNSWLVSPSYDLLFFSTVWYPFALLFFYKGCLAAGISTIAFSIVIFHLFNRLPHFIATTRVTYMMKENLDYYKKHWVAYFVIPALIITLYSLPILIHMNLNSYWYQILIYLGVVWGVEHIGMQNFGIVSLYRRRLQNGPTDPNVIRKQSQMDKWLFVFLFVAICVGDLNKQIFVPASMKHWIAPITVALYAGFGLYAAFYLWQCFTRRISFSLPLALYLITSVGVMIQWGFYASLPALTFFYVFSGHHNWAYTGLTYFMESNYKSTQISIKRFLAYYLPLVALAGAAIFLFNSYRSFAQFNDFGMRIGIGFFVVHYYLDSLVWRFRNEHNRKVVLPLLRRPLLEQPPTQLAA